MSVPRRSSDELTPQSAWAPGLTGNRCTPRGHCCLSPQPRVTERLVSKRREARVIFKSVRYFLSRGHAPVGSILLVESGSRGLLERAIVPLRRTWGDDIFIDLVTCYSGLPHGFAPETTRVYHTGDYRGRQGRRRLYRLLVQNRYALVGIVCSAQPLMTKWKWALAFRIPAKIFIINENGDYFPVEFHQWPNLWRLILIRAELDDGGAVRTLARVISFPFSLVYLLLYATTIHARRALRRG